MSTNSTVPSATVSNQPPVIVPALSYGDFQLGASLVDIITLLRRQSNKYRQVEVCCDDVNPIGKDIVLQVPHDHITLRFDARRHCLYLISVTHLSHIQATYHGKAICTAQFPPTFPRLYEAFGPSLLGDMDKTSGVYTLQYPGVEFKFQIPLEHTGLYGTVGGTHPMKLPDGTTPIAIQMDIVSGATANNGSIFSAAARLPQPGDDVKLLLGRGILFVATGTKIEFGNCPQDVVAILGPPAAVFDQTDERMGIHMPQGAQQPVHRCNFFFNYFAFGLDLLFDGITCELKKIVIHNSIPPHDSFLVYHRCHFSLELDASVTATSNRGSFNRSVSKALVQNEMTWKEIQSSLGGADAVPQPLLGNTPYGTLKIYALKGVIFHVLSNDCIASLTLFDPTFVTNLVSGSAAH